MRLAKRGKNLWMELMHFGGCSAIQVIDTFVLDYSVAKLCCRNLPVFIKEAYLAFCHGHSSKFMIAGLKIGVKFLTAFSAQPECSVRSLAPLIAVLIVL